MRIGRRATNLMGARSDLRLADGREEDAVLGQLGLQRALELRMDLADTALGEAEDVADLPQREVLDVEQDGDLALALGQRIERAAEALLRVRGGGGLLGVEAPVV